MRRIETKANKMIITRTDAINTYLKDIAKYKVMNRKEEREAIIRYKNGDIKAKHEIIQSNQRFIFSLAKNYGNGEKILDLVNEGNIGLIEAIDNFDLSKNVKFISHAVWYIRRAMNAYIMNDDMLIKKTNRTVTTYKINKFKNKFFAENGRMPSNIEIIDMLKDEHNINIKYEEDIYDVKTDYISTTFDDDDKNAFENSTLFQSKTLTSNTYDESIINEHYKDRIMSLLKCLTTREREIICMCFGIGYDYEYDLEDIAMIYDISAERIRQLKKSAINKMHNASIISA